MNIHALEDAALFFRTGRVRSPSPTTSSDFDGELPQLRSPETEDRRNIIIRKQASGELFLKEKLLNAHVFAYTIFLSSDIETEFCRCDDLTQEHAQVELPVTSSDEIETDSDSDFHLSDVDTGK